MDPTQAAQHLTLLMGWLKALYWRHWTAHWQALGDYGDHLLMQRLYEGVAEQIDGLAEKAVGGYGNDAVDPMVISRAEQMILSQHQGEDGLVHALHLEKQFQEVLDKCYQHLKEGGRMPMGLDDFIMGLAGEHDTYIYLLQQRLRGRRAALNSLERSWMGMSSFAPLRNATEGEAPVAEETPADPATQLAAMWKFSPVTTGGCTCT